MKQCAIQFILISALLVRGQTDTNYRLNSVVWPNSYTISIKPYFDTDDDRAFTFDGEVTISVQTTEANVNQIKLHSEDLIFTSNNITLTRGSTTLALQANNPLQFDDTYKFVYINLGAPLQTSTEHTIRILYRGPIRDDLNGFYSSSYVEQGVKKWLGATQMEPTHARKVFPCFDEPQYKATFTIIIDRPTSYNTTLANTEIQSSVAISADMTRDTFHPTPRMSTYLVAFLVSEFRGEYSNNEFRPLGVYSRPEAISQAGYALEIGRLIVDALSNYLAVDYYSTNEHLKLDHIAVPDFRAGAMENWGLVKYREGLLLYVPDESTPYYKYRVAQIVAHETAHMWFGNLVTCQWWSNIWLNEGFANYFENFITARVAPEYEASDVLVSGSLHAAFAADEIPTSPALTNENVNSPSEISGHFGTITYQKGGSIIRMIHHLIGDDAFRFGLNSYLETNKFDVGLPFKMYEALETGVNYSSVFSDVYPGHTVTNVMDSWISKPGYPILNVNIDYSTESVTLEQTRFYINSSINSEELYYIPITYTTQMSPNFDDTKPAFIMDTKIRTLQIANISSDDSWVILNIQETGFYRVNYDNNSWRRISRSLRGATRTNIHHINRAKIVNDLFAFLNGDVVEFELLYDVFEFLSEETDYSVWVSTINGFNALRNKFMYDPAAVEKIDEYTLHLMEHVLSEVGYEERSTDNYVTLRKRMLLLEYACKIGHQGCIDHAVATFQLFKENGTSVSSSLRPVTYCNALRYGDGDDFDVLWDRMLSNNIANEVLVIQTALGCTRVQDKLLSYLGSVTEADTFIRLQDITSPLTSVLQDHKNVHFVFEFLKNNYLNLIEKYPSMATVLSYIPAAMHTDSDLEEFETWLNECSECSSEAVESAKSAMRNSRTFTDWAKNHYSEIIGSLPGAASLNLPSLLGLIFAFTTASLM